MVLNDRFSFYVILQKKHYYLIFIYSYTSTIVSIFLCANQGQKKSYKIFPSCYIKKVTFDLLILLSLLRFSLIDSETRLLSLIVSNTIICFISLFIYLKTFTETLILERIKRHFYLYLKHYQIQL